MTSIFFYGSHGHANSRTETFTCVLAASDGRGCRVTLVVAEPNPDDSLVS